MWNFGSLLGVYLGVQLVRGIFLALHYSGNVVLSFDRVVHICRDVNYGWFMRVVHSNGASLFFLFLYFHIGRGIYYGSYRFVRTWLRGVTIFLLAMATAFLGYVLPWGQMSFWAATVITNLLSAIPYVGVMLVEWVWGGFAVGNPTLTRFFSFHFVLPFVIAFLVVLHLMFLHETGSRNALGAGGDEDRVMFHPMFVVRDVVGVLIRFMVLLFVCLEFPYVFMDVENFIPSNPLVTPVHIQPEWYFLFAYTILRSIARKIGGVVALVMSVLVLYVFPFVYRHEGRATGFYEGARGLFWLLVVNWLLLTWIGACVVEYPYRDLGRGFSVVYFLGWVGLWGGYEVQDKVLVWF
jgi:ubiquinol-cytochrome c reductase cytochrome b subunit